MCNMSNARQGGCPPFTPPVLTNYRSLLAPEYTGPTPPPESNSVLSKNNSELPKDNSELYEAPIAYEVAPPSLTPEYLPPTEILAPHEDF